VRILRRNDGADVSPDTVVYPLARKVRGRPKGTGKTLNTVYKKKTEKRCFRMRLIHFHNRLQVTVSNVVSLSPQRLRVSGERMP